MRRPSWDRRPPVHTNGESVAVTRCPPSTRPSQTSILHAIIDVPRSSLTAKALLATGGPWFSLASLESPQPSIETGPSMPRPAGTGSATVTLPDAARRCQTPHVHDEHTHLPLPSAHFACATWLSDRPLRHVLSERRETNHEDLTRVAWFLVLQIIYFI